MQTGNYCDNVHTVVCLLSSNYQYKEMFSSNYKAFASKLLEFFEKIIHHSVLHPDVQTKYYNNDVCSRSTLHPLLLSISWHSINK